MKLKIGITGQDGFIGGHLYNTIGLFTDEFERIEFKREFFDDKRKMNVFVSQCDVVVHLAALNRHNDPQIIYDVNVELVNKLIHSLIETNSNAHILFSSSSQEDTENVYGKSKKEGRLLLANWAKRTGGSFTGLVIPNVFGPFGHPYYNSFISTFCHQLTHDEQPTIEVDGTVNLIYIGDLIKEFLAEIRSKAGKDLQVISHTDQKKVSEILNILDVYKNQYLYLGVIPNLKNNFEVNLFNTFRSYIDVEEHYPVKFIKHTDPRGEFVEVIRLNIGGQVSFSTTIPGITRGNHFHTRKIERFAVIKGEALIQMRKIGTDKILNFYLSGKEPAYVDMPIWYTHNITNIGDGELYTNFWISEFFNAADTDTYFETV